jgi:ElaB/YqjD/DUF883 family membrane-anchored ribosome-binding protein
MNADSPLTIGSALYSYGFLNIQNHIDNADFRFGVLQGRDEGAAATYNALRDSLSHLNLPALSSNPTIDEVLKIVEQAANAIKTLVEKLNQLLDAAQQTITNLNTQINALSQQLQATLSQFSRTGKSISILAGAGAGMLIAGPAGALGGSVLGGLFG